MSIEFRIEAEMAFDDVLRNDRKTPKYPYSLIYSALKRKTIRSLQRASSY